MSNLKDYINEVMNDNRIFSHEDVVAMDNEEGKYYQKALDYQYGKIGFPMNAELANSSDVVYVHEYTRDDGTVVRAHYRSKAGHAAPDKPVMKSPQEYKSELEKEINDYMDRDVQERYGAGVNKADKDTDYLQELIEMLPETELEHEKPQTPEIETKYTPLYPSNGMLTGQVEISHDVSTEIPAVNIQPFSKSSTQPKPISKPYTGREMNISSAQLSKQQFNNIKLEKNKQHTSTKDLLDPNGLLYKVAKHSAGPNIQAFAGKSEIVSKLLNKNRPLSAEYYRLSLNPEKYKKNDNENIYKKISDFDGTHLENHLMRLDEKITSNTMVVLPKLDSRLVKALKQSHTLHNFIRQHRKEILNGQVRYKSIPYLNFYDENDLKTLIGEAHIYNAYVDASGNLFIQIPDYYNFIDRGQDTPAEAINYNAYIQQERGELTNYVLLITIKFSKEELKNILNNG